MHHLRSILLASAMVAVTFPALAQTRPQVAVEFEGPIQSIDSNGQGGIALVVNGIKVDIPASTISAGNVHTPTTKLMTPDLIESRNPFPGLNKEGFRGGTAIVIGNSHSLGVTAEDVFLEPAENVILGAVTANSDGKFEVEGVPVVLLPPASGGTSYPPGAVTTPDPRLPGLPMKNELGLTIKPENVEQYAEAALEGYFGSNGTFYAFSIDSVSEVADPSPTATILRAQCRVRSATQIEWEIRGGTYPWAAGATVSILPPPPPATPTVPATPVYNGNRAYSTNVAVQQDTVDLNAGAFRYTARPTVTATTNGGSACPPTVLVKYNQYPNAPAASASVEIR